jgi:two-component system LytT family response regulator
MPLTTTSLRVVIVDDEPLARRRLRSLLADEADVEIVGEFGNGRDAVRAIREQRPDLVFLDIQMPELDGFGVVREVGTEAMPDVIFVTAYDEHALKAFEVHALDYLLKPVDRERFAAALRRAKAHVGADHARGLGGRLESLLDELAKQHRAPQRIAIRKDGRIFLVRPEDIDWLEADGNHVRVHVGKESHVIRETLGNLEERLPERAFMRIHRSTIVNITRIREIQAWFQGDYVLLLHDGTRLTSGRTYRDRVRSLFEQV